MQILLQSFTASASSTDYISLNGNSSKVSTVVSVSNVNGSIFYNTLDARNNGTGLLLTNVTGSSVSSSNLNYNSLDGISGIRQFANHHRRKTISRAISRVSH